MNDDFIASKIYFLRGDRVLLDFDLANLYGVETKQLKRQVRRNMDRFPEDFMFQLKQAEYEVLRSQIGTLKRGEHFLGANDPYSAWKTTLKAEINQEAWESLHNDTSRSFPKPKNRRITVKVINHLGDGVMKVFKVG